MADLSNQKVQCDGYPVWLQEDLAHIGARNFLVGPSFVSPVPADNFGGDALGELQCDQQQKDLQTIF